MRGEVSGRLCVATIVRPDFLHLGEFMRVIRNRLPLVEVARGCFAGVEAQQRGRGGRRAHDSQPGRPSASVSPW